MFNKVEKGFSLVELLIVLVVLALLLGIVGPMGTKMLDSMERKVESEKFRNLIQASSERAFFLQHSLLLKLNSNKLELMAGSNTIAEYQFKLLQFEPSAYAINAQGYMEPTKISYRADKKNYKVELDCQVEFVVCEK